MLTNLLKMCHHFACRHFYNSKIFQKGRGHPLPSYPSPRPAVHKRTDQRWTLILLLETWELCMHIRKHDFKVKYALYAVRCLLCNLTRTSIELAVDINYVADNMVISSYFLHHSTCKSPFLTNPITG